MSGVQAGGRGGVPHLYVVAIKKQFMAAAGFSRAPAQARRLCHQLIAKWYQMKRADTQVRPYNTPGFQVTRCIYPVFLANGLGIFPRTQNLKPKTRP